MSGKRDVRGRLRFVDLFAGIGGFRLGLERAGMQCCFSCEVDPHARTTYEANFEAVQAGDVRYLRPGRIPDFDVLAAGFPCQPFSLGGLSKLQSLGRATGLDDRVRGTLFFEIARIIKARRPRAFILENVKGPLWHKGGHTLNTMLDVLRRKLGYAVRMQVYDASPVLPQKRERVFVVGWREPEEAARFEFPKLPELRPTLAAILERRPPPGYVLSDRLWQYLQEYRERQRARGNGFGFSLVGPQDVARTLSARYGKDGSEILVRRRGGNPRRLTPRECARLMGFPDDFVIPASDTQAYRQFGNAVAPPVVEEVGRALVRSLRAGRRAA